jgi:excisionase family DNA binding protein
LISSDIEILRTNWCASWIGFNSLNGKVDNVDHVTGIFNDLISKEQFAAAVGLSSKTISNWISQGRIRAVKIGRKNWLLKSTVEEWLREKEKIRILPKRSRRAKHGRL